MSLLDGQVAANEQGHEQAPAGSAPAPAETAAGIAAGDVAEVRYDLLMVEALKVNSLMTAARFHRDEAANPRMPEWQAELHQGQFEGFVSKLGELGVNADDIPEASLKYSGSTESDHSRLMAPAAGPAAV